MIYQRRKLGYLFSGLLFIGSLVAVLWLKLPLGIDFTGGNIAEIKTGTATTADAIRAQLVDKKIEAVVQTTKEGTYLIKFADPASPTPSASPDNKESTPKQGEISNQTAQILKDVAGEKGSLLRFERVGPTVGKSLQQKALYSIILASAGIILYLAWAFRGVGKVVSNWTFGVMAVLALIHDLVIVTGIFTIIGYFYKGVSIDTYFITALLTILGYSVNDTIVIFDRLREVLHRQSNLTVPQAVDRSIMQTLSRSVNTSFTVLLVILPLLILGGGAITSFLIPLTFGVVFGTYSSIFIAAPLLADWEGFKLRRSRQIELRKR